MHGWGISKLFILSRSLTRIVHMLHRMLNGVHSNASWNMPELVALKCIEFNEFLWWKVWRHIYMIRLFVIILIIHKHHLLLCSLCFAYVFSNLVCCSRIELHHRVFFGAWSCEHRAIFDGLRPGMFESLEFQAWLQRCWSHIFIVLTHNPRGAHIIHTFLENGSSIR